MFWSAEMTRKMSMEIIYNENKEVIDKIGKKIKEAVKDKITYISIPIEECNEDVYNYIKGWGYKIDGWNSTYIISWL